MSTTSKKYVAIVENGFGSIGYVVASTKAALYAALSKSLGEDGDGLDNGDIDVSNIEELTIECFEVTSSWFVEASVAGIKITEK